MNITLRNAVLMSCFISNTEYYKQDHQRNISFTLIYSHKINDTDVVYSFASFSPICRFTEISWAKLGNN